MIIYNWIGFMNHMKSLTIIIFQMDFFQGVDRKYMIN